MHRQASGNIWRTGDQSASSILLVDSGRQVVFDPSIPPVGNGQLVVAVDTQALPAIASAVGPADLRDCPPLALATLWRGRGRGRRFSNERQGGGAGGAHRQSTASPLARERIGADPQDKEQLGFCGRSGLRPDIAGLTRAHPILLF